VTTRIALHQPQALQRRASQTVAPAGVSRSRRSLAKTLEVALDPGHGVRRGLNSWPRIPRANRVAVAEPMREIILLLHDPAKAIPERTWQRVLAFVSHPASPAFGEYPNQAGFAAYTLVAEVRAGTA
jgi:hypothetical protein